MPESVPYRLIDFSASDTGNGSLAMFQSGPAGPEIPAALRGLLPFDIKKVLVVSGMKPGDVRGKHAHRETQEIIIPIHGGCDFEIDDGTTVHSVSLHGMKQGLLLPPCVWRTFKNFEEGTIILIIADQFYNEKDYVRDYGEFTRMMRA